MSTKLNNSWESGPPAIGPLSGCYSRAEVLSALFEGWKKPRWPAQVTELESGRAGTGTPARVSPVYVRAMAVFPPEVTVDVSA